MHRPLDDNAIIFAGPFKLFSQADSIMFRLLCIADYEGTTKVGIFDNIQHPALLRYVNSLVEQNRNLIRFPYTQRCAYMPYLIFYLVLMVAATASSVV